MTAPPLSDQVKAFFDEFVEAFATFDGSYIARRYAVPYLAMHADGSTELFHSTTAIGEYFQRVVDEYRARDCRSCRYIDLAVVGIGRSAALGTVTWELLRADGSILVSWRESYHLAQSDGVVKAFVSVDHVD